MEKYFKLIQKFFDVSDVNIKKAAVVLGNVFNSFPANKIALSLNGGKDSTVVLFLTLYVMKQKQLEEGLSSRLKCIYMKEQNPFPEIIGYMNKLEEQFEIDVYEYQNKTNITQDFMKNSLRDFVDNHGIEAIISGTRSTDPYCQGLDLTMKTDIDKHWPEFLRVMPIYYWDYKTVWDFMLKTELPYCSLYDIGYTYVGDRVNSISNPFIGNKPAYHANDNVELFSRTKLFNGLPRKDNALVFSDTNLQFVVNHVKGGQKGLSEEERNLIRNEVTAFAKNNNCIIEIDLNHPKSVFIDCDNEQLKNAKILEIKRQHGNFNKLFLFVIYNSTSKEVLIGF